MILPVVLNIFGIAIGFSLSGFLSSTILDRSQFACFFSEDVNNDLDDEIQSPSIESLDSLGDPVLPIHVSTSPSDYSFTLAQAKTRINAISQQSNNDGVVIIDEGGIDESYFAPNVVCVNSDQLYWSDHATNVSYVISSQNGIHPYESLYFKNKYTVGAQNAFQNILAPTASRHLANASFGSIYGNGNYTKEDVFFDYYASQYDTTFVVSAGNNGGYSSYISAPGCSLNAITVGSTNYENQVSYFSSFDLTNDYDGKILKPTLVAPGENIILTGYDLCSGTSYAAPFVTAAISSLDAYCNYFPNLQQYPHLSGVSVSSVPEFAQSLLLNSATSITGHECVWDFHSGGGLLNVQEALGMLTNHFYSLFSSNNVNNNDTLSTIYLTVDPGDKIDLVLCHKYYPDSTDADANSNDSVDVAVTPYSIVATANGGINKEFTNVGNVTYGTIFNTTQSALTYTISIVARGDNIEASSLQRFALTWLPSEHNHEYIDHYFSLNSIKHIAYCACGLSVQQAHTWSSPHISNGGLVVECTKCGEEKNYGNTPIPHD